MFFWWTWNLKKRKKKEKKIPKRRIFFCYLLPHFQTKLETKKIIHGTFTSTHDTYSHTLSTLTSSRAITTSYTADDVNKTQNITYITLLFFFFQSYLTGELPYTRTLPTHITIDIDYIRSYVVYKMLQVRVVCRRLRGTTAIHLALTSITSS